MRKIFLSVLSAVLLALVPTANGVHSASKGSVMSNAAVAHAVPPSVIVPHSLSPSPAGGSAASRRLCDGCRSFVARSNLRRQRDADACLAHCVVEVTSGRKDQMPGVAAAAGGGVGSETPREIEVEIDTKVVEMCSSSCPRPVAVSEAAVCLSWCGAVDDAESATETAPAKEKGGAMETTASMGGGAGVGEGEGSIGASGESGTATSAIGSTSTGGSTSTSGADGAVGSTAGTTAAPPKGQKPKREADVPEVVPAKNAEEEEVQAPIVGKGEGGNPGDSAPALPVPSIMVKASGSTGSGSNNNNNNNNVEASSPASLASLASSSSSSSASSVSPSPSPSPIAAEAAIGGAVGDDEKPGDANPDDVGLLGKASIDGGNGGNGGNVGNVGISEVATNAASAAGAAGGNVGSAADGAGVFIPGPGGLPASAQGQPGGSPTSEAASFSMVSSGASMLAAAIACLAMISIVSGSWVPWQGSYDDDGDDSHHHRGDPGANGGERSEYVPLNPSDVV